MKIIKIIILISLFNIFFSLIKYLKENNIEIATLQKNINYQNEKLHNLELVKMDLEIEAKNLETLEVVEKIARNKLDMKKKGEEIYRIVK